MLVDVKGYAEKGVAICPNGTIGDHVEIGGVLIALPKAPKVKHILYHDHPIEEQYWRKADLPQELSRIRSMDEWAEMPRSSERSFVHISKRSFGVGVRAFGFIIEVMLHTSRVGII
jgi:hypothetical protein